MANRKTAPRTVPAGRARRNPQPNAIPSATPRKLKPNARVNPPDHHPKDCLADIKGGLDNEMRGAIIKNVSDLIERRLPDELFRRILQPRDDIALVDASELQANDADKQVDSEDADDQNRPQSSLVPAEPQVVPNDVGKLSKVDASQGPTTAGDHKEPRPERARADEAYTVDASHRQGLRINRDLPPAKLSRPATWHAYGVDAFETDDELHDGQDLHTTEDDESDSEGWSASENRTDAPLMDGKSDVIEGLQTTVDDKKSCSTDRAATEVPPPSAYPSTPSSATCIGEDDSIPSAGNEHAAPSVAKNYPGKDNTPSVDNIYEDLCGETPTYDTKRMEWIGWPDNNKQKKEHEIADYLNKIVERVREKFCIERQHDDWVFSAKFANSPLDKDGIKRKPDLVLMRRTDAGMEADSEYDIHWGGIRAVGELKSKVYGPRVIARDSCKYIREMYRAEKSCRFALSFAIVADVMMLIKYDRSGALVCKPFDIHMNPKQFLRVVIGMALGEDYYLGLDPSFSREGDREYITIDDEKFEILEEIQIEASIRGRGTVTLLIEHPYTGKRYVLKEQWVDRDRTLTESEILEKLTKGKGKRNIVKLVKYKKVAFKIGQSTELDTTETDREEIKEKDLEEVETRDHYRLLLTPYGVDVTKFESLRELVSVFKDYAETIYDLYKAGYYHRDISERNLIIVDDEDIEEPEQSDAASHNEHHKDTSRQQCDASASHAAEPRIDCSEYPEEALDPLYERLESPEDSTNSRPPRTGYIIDFDCAAEKAHVRTATAFLTGTLPFMAPDMLENSGGEHKFYYDLESLFYVFVWVCTLQDGPRRKNHCPYSDYQYEGSVLEEWNGGKKMPHDAEESAFQRIGRIKRTAMENRNMFKSLILDHLPAYFKPIEGLIKELRGILFMPGLDCLGPDVSEDLRPTCEREDEDRVFIRFIGALERARDQLPLTDEEFGGPPEDAPGRPRRIAAARCRDVLQSVAKAERSDGDDPKGKRKRSDADDTDCRPGSPLDGKGKSRAGSKSGKRPTPEAPSSSKCSCTLNSRSGAKRSRS